MTDLPRNTVLVRRDKFTDPPSKQGDAHTARAAALGAVYGAFAADAAGATLEFLGRKPSAGEVEEALAMCGGGVWSTAPGQITDDSELALCQLRALSGSATFSLEAIASRYADWYRSPPFDIGNTTSSALGPGARAAPGHVAATMREAAAARNMGSKANGALMRLTPLAVWASRGTPDEVAGWAMADAALTHPNASCQEASACYALAIGHLVGHPCQGRDAWRVARDWASGNAGPEVCGWLEEARAGLVVPGTPLDGFVRIAFVHAFRHLWMGTGYLDAVRETLALGGDTDTNAAIVGGLVGAAWGAGSIPGSMKAALETCDTRQGRERPDWLSTRDLHALVMGLLPEEEGAGALPLG